MRKVEDDMFWGQEQGRNHVGVSLSEQGLVVVVVVERVAIRGTEVDVDETGEVCLHASVDVDPPSV